MNVYCREHGKSLGVVELSPVGVRKFVYRSARWRDRHAAMAQIEGRHNANEHLDDRGRGVTTVKTDACGQCGRRDLPINDLIAAFEAGLPKIRV
jgi:hypothetical protein